MLPVPRMSVRSATQRVMAQQRRLRSGDQGREAGERRKSQREITDIG